MSTEEIDGALVGGASLDPKSFAAIVQVLIMKMERRVPRPCPRPFPNALLP